MFPSRSNISTYFVHYAEYMAHSGDYGHYLGNDMHEYYIELKDRRPNHY